MNVTRRHKIRNEINRARSGVIQVLHDTQRQSKWCDDVTQLTPDTRVQKTILLRTAGKRGGILPTKEVEEETTENVNIPLY